MKYNSTNSLSLEPKDPNCIYIIGLDPIWSISKNSLQYVNSFKMKFAVILGVLQMTIGIIVKATNCIYFKHYNELINEFIP